MSSESHRIALAGLTRELPLVPIPGGGRAPYVRTLGDTELLQAIGRAIAAGLPSGTEMIVGPEAGGIVIAHEVSVASGLPYVIARKRRVPDMVEPILVEDVKTAFTHRPQQLWLGNEDVRRLRRRDVALVDEATTSGATLDALDRLMHRSEANAVAKLVVVAQGHRPAGVTALCELPILH